MRQFRNLPYYLTEEGKCFRHYPKRDYVYKAKFDKYGTYTNAYEQEAKTKPIKATRVGNGYLKYSLWYEGKSFQSPAHRIVYEAFNGPIPEGMEIHHIDGDKQNNHISNLQMVSREENLNYREWQKK